MRKHHLLIAFVLVGLGVALWMWPQGKTSSGDEQASPSANTALAKRQEARLRGQVNSEPASISGQVRSADSNDPIAGALVSIALRKIDGGLVGQAGQSAAPLSAKTDSEGRFTIEKLRPGRYSLSTTMKGYKPQNLEGLMLEGGQDLDNIDLLLQPGGHLVTGTVTDIGGGPVGFAFVRARKISEFTVSSFFRAPLTAATNADGEYELSLDSGKYAFEVFHEDYRTEKKRRVVDGQDRRVDFVLTPGSVIEGVVLMAGDDTPVAGATVSWNRMGESGGFVLSGITVNGSAETDEQGRFSLRGLGSGALELRAFSPHSASREPTIVELSIAETVSEVVVYVDSAFTVSGFVVNKGSKKEAASDVMVGAYNLSPGALFAASVPSASDGYFEIHGVQPGSYTVGALAEEKLPRLFGESITVVDQDLTDIVISVDGGHTLRGTVYPPQVATITLEMDMKEVGFSNMMQMAGSFLVRTRSDESGEFALKGVSRGSYTVVAKAEGGSQGRLEVEVNEDQDKLRIEMEERGSASGIVVDASGKAVEGVEVRFESHDPRKQGGFNFRGPGMGREQAITGSDGRFRKVGLADGGYNLRVYAGAQISWAGKSGEEGREPQVIQITAGNDLRDLRLAVEARTHKITGTVIDPEGAPLPDAWVTATRVADVGAPEEDEEKNEWRRFGERETPVLSDSSGAFKIRNLRSGLYDITAEATQSGAKGVVERVKMDTRVSVRIEKMGKLSGTVTQAGAPVKDYILMVKGPQRRRIHVARDNGSFSLPRLESGDYSIEVTSTKGVASAEAKVLPGEETTADIKLATFGSITGVLLNASTGEPMPNISAVATMDRDESKFASNAMELITGVGPRTGDEGEFRVGKLGSGKGSIYFMDPKAKGFHIIAQKEFELDSGETLDLGDIQGALALDAVPEDERGTLGMFTAVARTCPSDPEKVPEESEKEVDHLWIVVVVEGGPADDAGAKVCDRITAVNGMEHSQIGARILQQPLRRGVAVDTTYTLNIVRDSGPTTLTIEAELDEQGDEPEMPIPQKPPDSE